MTPTFLGTVTSGRLVLEPTVKALLARHLKTLDGPVVLTVQKPTKLASSRQRRYYFGVVIPLIAEHLGYTKDEMHETLMWKFLRLPDDNAMGVPRRQHWPTGESKEMAEYLDNCIRLAAELGVYIPAPGEVV